MLAAHLPVPAHSAVLLLPRLGRSFAPPPPPAAGPEQHRLCTAWSALWAGRGDHCLGWNCMQGQRGHAAPVPSRFQGRLVSSHCLQVRWYESLPAASRWLMPLALPHLLQPPLQHSPGGRGRCVPGVRPQALACRFDFFVPSGGCRCFLNNCAGQKGGRRVPHYSRPPDHALFRPALQRSSCGSKTALEHPGGSQFYIKASGARSATMVLRLQRQQSRKCYRRPG